MSPQNPDSPKFAQLNKTMPIRLNPYFYFVLLAAILSLSACSVSKPDDTYGYFIPSPTPYSAEDEGGYAIATDVLVFPTRIPIPTPTVNIQTTNTIPSECTKTDFSTLPVSDANGVPTVRFPKNENPITGNIVIEVNPTTHQVENVIGGTSFTSAENRVSSWYLCVAPVGQFANSDEYTSSDHFFFQNFMVISTLATSGKLK